MKAEIIRIEVGGEGTFGVLTLDGQAFCVTLELPWRGNVQGISSIPPGRYLCQRVKSEAIKRITDGEFTETFEITGVPGRFKILLHPGNLLSNSKGCVLVASSYGKLKGERAVLNSGATFRQLMTVLRNVNAFSLHVRDVDLTPEVVNG